MENVMAKHAMSKQAAISSAGSKTQSTSTEEEENSNNQFSTSPEMEPHQSRTNMTVRTKSPHQPSSPEAVRSSSALQVPKEANASTSIITSDDSATSISENIINKPSSPSRNNKNSKPGSPNLRKTGSYNDANGPREEWCERVCAKEKREN